MQMMCKNASCKTYVHIDDPEKAVQFLKKSSAQLKFSCFLGIKFFVWTYSTDSYSAVSLILQDKWKDRKILSKGFEVQRVLQAFIETCLAEETTEGKKQYRWSYITSFSL